MRLLRQQISFSDQFSSKFLHLNMIKSNKKLPFPHTMEFRLYLDCFSVFV